MANSSGPSISSSDLDDRRKKILFRAWHRGIKEMDIVLGNFADAHLKSMDEADLDILEHLMDAPDRELFKWISGEVETPEHYRSHVMDRIQAFHNI